MIGPRQRRRRRRQLGKLLALCMVLTALAMVSSWARLREAPVPGRWDNPTPAQLGAARRYCEINGAANGASPWYLDIWAPWAPYIRGEVDTIDACG